MATSHMATMQLVLVRSALAMAGSLGDQLMHYIRRHLDEQRETAQKTSQLAACHRTRGQSVVDWAT